MRRNLTFKTIPQNWGWVVAMIVLAALILFLSYWPPLEDSWSTFTTVFLGIFIEAVPFLLLGTLASGLVEVFVNQDAIRKFTPASPILAALMGSLMGMFFPVCECGVVPLTRRLFRKGLPIPAGIAFLLAAPVINPVVILSTASAFGFGNMLLMRVGFTLLIAVVVGLVFTVVKEPWDILQPSIWITSESADVHEHSRQHEDHEHDEAETHAHMPGHDHAHDHMHEHTAGQSGFLGKLEQVFQVTLDEFFEIGRYLVLGSVISAGMQAFIPQNFLLGVGKGPVLSVLVMMALAILLSICSTVDSFIALGFTGLFSSGSILAFLLYGPMVDIKSTLMFLRVFRPRVVFYLVVLPFVLVLLISVSLNYFWVW
ncbi:MAG: permease [Anaerolineae bacterium]|nr:permease [Anaerolineae bacterium]